MQVVTGRNIFEPSYTGKMICYASQFARVVTAFALVFILLSFHKTINAQTIIWSEDFQYSNGTSAGVGVPSGVTSWVADGANGSNRGITVVGNQLQARQSNNGNDTWEINEGDAIDISGYNYVSVSVDIACLANGELESNTDYVRLRYQIDGGDWQPFPTEYYWGEFSSSVVQASVLNLSGNELRIEITMYNTANNEYYYADNIVVTGSNDVFISYCSSNGTTQYGDRITLVRFNTINNSTGKPAGYNDYTSMSTDVILGDSYELSVNLDTDGDFKNYAKAWIDWNKNGVFESSEEYDLGYVVNSSNGTTSNSPYSITIPNFATLGQTRMRVSTKFDAEPNACEDDFDGEVEDYTINIVSPCNAPDIPVLSTSSTTVCSGENVVLNISGNLNDADHWAVYSGSCGGTLVGTTTSGSFTITDISASTSYYVRGEGTCSGTVCGSVAITVNPSPTITTQPSATSICAGESTTISVGSSSETDFVQWQTATNSVGPWSPVSTLLNSNPVFFESDFSSVPTNSDVYRAASVTGGVLQLTPAVGTQYGGFVIQSTPGENFNVLNVSFDYRIWGGTGADGFSLSYGPDIANSAGTGEVGEGTGIIVEFDTYDNNEGTTDSQIRVKYNGNQIFNNNVGDFNLRNANYRNVNIHVDQSGYLSLRIARTQIVSNLLLPNYVSTAKQNWKFKFSGRTGGSNDVHSIDNLKIQFGNDPSFLITPTESTYYRAIVSSGDCSVISDEVLVAVNTPPSASISGNSGPACEGENINFTITGTANSTVIYSINGGSNQTATLTGGQATISNTATGSSQTLNLVSVSIGGCTTTLSESSTVSVNSLPVANVSENSGAVCEGENASFTITGTNNAVVTYTINGGSTQTVALSGGEATINVLNASVDQTLNLVSVDDGTCSVSLSESSTVNIEPAFSAPIIGTVTQPTCDVFTGSVELSGLPLNEIWGLIKNPGADTVFGAGANTTISELDAGNYTFSVINQSGSGLSAEYFNNRTLSGTPVLSRIDETVDFDWDNGGPGSPVGNNNFSVRWAGKILPLYSEQYTFFTNSDDGIRLWVNGIQVINNWTDHSVKEDNGTITLSAGKLYDIVLEFYENGGQAVAQLSWSSASQPKQIIHKSQLFPEELVFSGCPSTASTEVTINTQPQAPSITTQPSTSDVAYCEGELASALSAVAVGDDLHYQWYRNTNSTTSGGTAVGTDNPSYTPLTTDVGTYFYYVIVSGDCTPNATSGISGAITVNALPNAPIASNLSNEYNGTVQSASATVAAGETIDWYTASTGGSLTTVPSGTNVGTYTAWAEARNTTTGCLSATRTKVTLTITKRAVTVTADDTGKNCTDADPSLTYEITNGSLATGDSFTGNLTRESGEVLGDYDILQGTLALNSNYNLVFVPGTFTIYDNEKPEVYCIPELAVYADSNGEAIITPEIIDNGSTDNCGIDTMWVSPAVLGCNEISESDIPSGYTKEIISSDGYTVKVSINDIWIEPATTNSIDCEYGYDYNIGYKYTVEFLGSNIPDKLSDLRIISFGCSQSLSGELPEVSGSGTAFSSGGYSDNSDCATVTIDDLNCGNIQVIISGPGIDNQTVTLDEIVSSNSSNFVTLNVKDKSGNVGTCETAITLVDTISPSITCPGEILQSIDPGSCVATGISLGTPATSDNCAVDTVFNDAPASFSIGTTVVTWTVSDVSGNTITCTQNVTIVPEEDVDVEVEDLGNSCQSGETGSTTTVTWNIIKQTGTENWTFDYQIKEGTTTVASGSNIAVNGNAEVSIEIDNETAKNKTLVLTILNVKDDCGTSETNATNNSDTVTLIGVPDTGDIITN